MKIKLNKEDIFLFFLTFIILGFFLYLFFPGILTYDSYSQLFQIETFQFSTWHPFFHTFIEMLLLKIWSSPAVIGLFQILVFSLMWTSICSYFRKNSKKIFIIEIILTLIICLNPIHFLYAITLWKDILYSYFLFYVCFLIKVLVDKKFNCSFKFLIFLSLMLALVANFRYNGLYIIIILVGVLMYFFYKKGKDKKYIFYFPCWTIIFLILFSSIQLFFPVRDNTKDAVEPKVMQYLSFYLKEEKITKNDKKIISKVANTNKLVKNYDATYSDDIYDITNHKAYKKEKTKLYKLALNYTFKYPNLAIQFIFESTDFIWNPLFPKNRKGLILVTDITSGNNYHNISPLHISEPLYQKTLKNINETINNPFLKVILYSPALYFYISILIMIIIFILGKVRSFLIYLPNFLNILIIAASNPVQDVRYLYPNLLLFYLILLIGIDYFLNSRSNKKRKG